MKWRVIPLHMEHAFMNMAIDEADLILFLVDAKTGIMPDDHALSKLLKKKSQKCRRKEKLMSFEILCGRKF